MSSSDKAPKKNNLLAALALFRRLIAYPAAGFAWLRRIINSKHGVNLAMAATFVVFWAYFIAVNGLRDGLLFCWIPALFIALIMGLLWPWLFIAGVIGLSVLILFYGIPDVLPPAF